MRRYQGRQALEKVLLCRRCALLLARKYHVQHRERASTDRNGRTQQAPGLVGLQIAPIDHDHRPLPTQQPAGHAGVDPLALVMQVPVAEQPIKGLERGLDALGTGPGAGDIGQGQSLRRHQRFDRTHQDRFAQRVHRLQ
jgi:hypothetical protein